MSQNIEIIIGTYEEFLLGYKLDKKNDKEVLTQSFADQSHSGALKCLAVQGRWIATGATDDRIFIYDMKSRKQSQILLSHDGTINALAFTPDQTHLLSAGDDGRLVAVRLNTWFTEANWKKAHSGSPVTHVSCHPSSKLALSLGSDLILRTWNLVKGRVAYKTNLKSKNATLGLTPDCLAWSPSGDFFTLSGQRVVEIWSIKTADVVRSHKTSSKPICVCWTSDDRCLVGLEDGNILWDTIEEDGKKELVIKAHNSRVKAMSVYKDILVTASSSGEIKMWRINLTKKTLKEIAATNIGCRPTCIGILDLDQFGSDYIVSNTTKQSQEESKLKIEKQITPPQQKGVVTIEYENNEDENVEDNEDDSIAEVESEASNSQLPKGEDVEPNDSTDSETDKDDTDDDDEPQIRLPITLKRKRQEQKLLVNQKQPKLAKSLTKGKNSHSKLQQKSKKYEDKKQKNKLKQKSN